GDGVDQSGQFIVAAVGDRGQVGIWRRADDRWLDLLPWTDSESVRPGSMANELTVDIAGSHLRFDVNGIRVASVEAPLASGRAAASTAGAASAAASTATLRSDPAAEARELAAAQARLTEVSAQVKHASDATGGTPEQGVRWREELGGVLDAVHQLTQDVGNDYARGNREAARVQRVTALLGQLEGEVAAALDGFSDGLGRPRR